MAAVRTQVYLTTEMRRRIDEVAHAEGVTMAEVVRRALDRYLEEDGDPSPALATTFGADPAAQMPDRAEWDRG